MGRGESARLKNHRSLKSSKSKKADMVISSRRNSQIGEQKWKTLRLSDRCLGINRDVAIIWPERSWKSIYSIDSTARAQDEARQERSRDPRFKAMVGAIVHCIELQESVISWAIFIQDEGLSG